MNSRQIYFAVHGRKAPRKSPRSQTGRGPARNWKYRCWIRSLPCAVCGDTRGIEAAHTGSDGGMAHKASDYTCIPLCGSCHTAGPHAYHRGSRAEFEARYDLDISVLVDRLNSLWFGHSRDVK